MPPSGRTIRRTHVRYPPGMAGGMARKGDGRTLHERIHGTLEPENVPPPIKPCSVTDRHRRLPGLLREWRRTAVGCQGRVVRPVLGPAGWIVVGGGAARPRVTIPGS